MSAMEEASVPARAPLKQLENALALDHADKRSVDKPSGTRGPGSPGRALPGEGPPEDDAGKNASTSAASQASQAVAASPLRKSPRRKKARVNSAGKATNDENRRQGDSGVGAAATPPLDKVELNTRRNSLRPVSSSKRKASAGARRNSDATITLADFQDMLDSAQDDDEDDDGDDEEADGEEREQGPTAQLSAPAGGDEDGDEDDEFDFGGDGGDRGDSKQGGDEEDRRNTASPSFLRSMLEMSDDDGSDDEGLLEAAAQRGKLKAEALSKGSEEQVTPQRAAQSDEPSPVAHRTRSSARKPRRPDSSSVAEAPGKQQELPVDSLLQSARKGPIPTPLKSCISARKRPESSVAKKKKKSVVFGSPNAAEFDTKDPVRGGVTPLNKNYARSRFKMEERRDSDDLIEEDGDTALNSSILATWDEESDSSSEEDKASDVRSEDKAEAVAAASPASKGSRGSANSRRSGRRTSGIFRGEMLPQDEPESLVSKFDQVASPPPPSPGTAEAQLRAGEGVPLRRLSSRGEAATGVEGMETGAEGNTVDFADLLQLQAESPASSRGRASLSSTTSSLPGADRTLDSQGLQDMLGQLSQEELDADDTMAVDEGSGAATVAEEHSHVQAEDATVELGKLSQLAAFSPARPGVAGAAAASPAAQAQVRADQTVELGDIAELATLSATSPAQPAQPAQPAAQPAEHTVELGELGELAQLSASPQQSEPVASNPPADTSDRTVELGDLAELAKLSPGDPKETGKRPETDEAPAPSQAAATLRLSFSSLVSSGSEMDKRQSSGGQDAAFNSAALLNQFLDSPNSARPSIGSTASDGNGARPSVGSAYSPAPPQGRKDDQAEEDDQDDQDDGKKEAIRSPMESSTKSPMRKSPMPPKPASAATPELDDEAAFKPKRDLARTPLRGDQQATDDAEGRSEASAERSEGDSRAPEEESQEETETQAPEPREPLSTEEVFASCGLSLTASLDDSDGPEEAVHQVSEEPDVQATSVTSDRLARACEYTASVYGLKWAVNELLQRCSSAQRTSTDIAQGLSRRNPELYEQMRNEATAEQAKRTLVAMLADAQLEARAGWHDFEKKTINLSMQVVAEHRGILKEDRNILKEGIARLDEALQATGNEIDKRERSNSLRAALQEQAAVLATYRTKVVEQEREKAELEAEAEGLRERMQELQTLKDRRESLAKREGSLEMTTKDLQSRSAVLDVVHGLHCWRLHQVTSSLVTLRLDLPNGSCDMISIGLDSTPVVSSVGCHHEAAADGSDARGELAEQIEGIAAQLVRRHVLQLNQSANGQEPSKLPHILRELDFSFGRLKDLWDEMLEISTSAPELAYTAKVAADERIEFSVECLHHAAGALVQVTFSLGGGYPLAQDSCRVAFRAVSDASDERVVEELERAAESDCRMGETFTPLSDKWYALAALFDV